MKKFIFALIAMVMMTVSATAMSYEQARQQALFLTDKMAYELNLTDEQYEAAYEINLDYLMGVRTSTICMVPIGSVATSTSATSCCRGSIALSVTPPISIVRSTGTQAIGISAFMPATRIATIFSLAVPQFT